MMAHIMRRIGLAIAASWLIAGVVHQAKANSVTHLFSGTITQVTGPAPPVLGDTFTGSMTYDDSTPNVYSGPDANTVGQYNPSPLIINLTITTSIHYNITDFAGFIQLINNNLTLAPPLVQNVFSADAISNTSASTGDRLQILIASQTTFPTIPAGPISSIELKGLTIDLATASSFRQVLFSHSDTANMSDDYSIKGFFTSFTTVPEPSTMVQGLAAVLMTLGFAWLRGKAGHRGAGG
jgi:hypothetical protein